MNLLEKIATNLNLQNEDFEKVAALDTLVAKGYDFNTAVSLVKQAEEDIKVSKGDIARSYISPAWAEKNIAKKHGKQGKGAGGLIGKHITGSLRAAGRAYGEGVLGGTAGYGAGKLTELAAKKLGKNLPHSGYAGLIGAGAGYVAGGLHGGYKSFKNQAIEAHKKYSGA